jgi:hypothetical protein
MGETVTVSREILQQALKALEQSETWVPYEGFGMLRREAQRKHEAAITAVKAALAQPEQEPVAWASKRELARIKDFDSTIYANGGFDGAVPLYTAPLRREWHSLSEEEIAKFWHDTPWNAGLKTRVFAFAAAIEVKLKEKNA